MTRQFCQVCGKQAYFQCSQCQVAVYCSQQHQVQHWKTHRQHCNIFKSTKMQQQQIIIAQKRLQLRTIYFQNYMYKMFDVCLKVAVEIVQLQKNHITITRQIFNQLQYGIGVCLLARSKINLKDQLEAMIIIKSYINEKMHFLEDLNDIYCLAQAHKFNSQVSTTMKQFSTKKASLLGSIAHIMHKVKLPLFLKIYHIYNDHVQKIFGKESVEASNCYFMVGTYYLQNLEFNKAIACFLRAAELRGNCAGDCYYNLGIIFKLIKKEKIAISMFENAAKMRQIQYGQNSPTVADVYHHIALLYESLKNYQKAIANLEKIVVIFSKEKDSEQYRTARYSIRSLQANLKRHLQLKSSQDNKNKQIIKSLIQDRNSQQIKESYKADYDYDKNKQSEGTHRLRVPDYLLKKLNPLELFHLSELQLQMQNCKSDFMGASAVGSSKFLRILSMEKLEDLKSNNLSLFKHIGFEKFMTQNKNNENQGEY